MRFPKPNNIVAEKYVAGMSLFKSKLAKIKLSANESALGPSPKARKQYLEVSKNFARYPDSDGTFLRNTLAKKFKIDKNRIILGSGSDQIFELICKSFLKKGDEVIVPKFSFIIYRIYSRMNGAKVIYSKENNFTVSTKDNKDIVIALNASGADVSYSEIITDKGHDSFLLNEPQFLKTLKGFIDSMYERFKNEKRI